MKTINQFIFLIVMLCLFGCKQDKTAIEKVVNSFYNHQITDYKMADKNLLSSELIELIKQAEKIELSSKERIKHSEFPTDKPVMIEGDIFTSVYEGQTGFEILEIKIKDNKATVLIELKNNLKKIPWQDEMQLIDQNGWKIDNVIFKNIHPDIGSTQALLKGFIDGYNNTN